MRPDAYEQLCEVAENVSRETFERLIAFEARFRQWNTRINLVSASTVDDFWTRHVVDSAQLINLAPSAARNWVDLGSGGGFPGLVLGFLLPLSARISLVESNRKKAGFLGAMTGEFGLPVDVHATRIEDVPAGVSADVVTARALAPLPNLLGLAERWLGTGAAGLFHKGREYRAELAECAGLWDFDLVEHASATGSGSVILEIRNLKAA